MADITQPLLDWGKSIATADPTKGAEELLNILEQLKVPGVDMHALAYSQRKNIDALCASNQAALAGLQATAAWQARLLHETMEELAGVIGALAKNHSPQQMVGEETELARKAFEAAIKQMQELAGIVTTANKEAAQAIAKRIPESLDEIRGILKIPPPPKTS